MRIGGATFPKPRNYHDAMHLAARVQDHYPLEKLITHRFGIRDATSALHAVETGVAIKAVIDPLL
jgi:5-exo-hydroxycamphor dehydrogenase